MLEPARFDLIVYQGASQYELFRLEEDTLPAPPFVVSSVYRSGTFVTPSTPNGSVYRVMSTGTAAGTEPTWPTVMGERVTSGSTTFMLVGATILADTSSDTLRAKIRRGDPENAEVLSMTIGNGLVERGYDPPQRANSTAYAVGQEVIPLTPNGWLYRCEVAGTSDSSAPTWPTVLGVSVTDGTVTWRCVDNDDDVTNFRVALTPGSTSPLANWGNGLWDVERVDAFGKVDRIIYGTAVMEREQTR